MLQFRTMLEFFHSIKPFFILAIFLNIFQLPLYNIFLPITSALSALHIRSLFLTKSFFVHPSEVSLCIFKLTFFI